MAGHSKAIAFFADQRYFPLAIAAALSAHRHASHIADVFVFTDDAVLAKRYAAHDRLIVRHIDAVDEIPAHAPLVGAISRMSYGRLFIGDLLPQHYDTVLYLDSDIAVEDSIADIFAIDVGTAPIAAVSDCGTFVRHNDNDIAHWAERMQAIGLRPDAPYFNAGVLLIDLRQWRAAGIPGRAIAFLSDHAGIEVLMDQDILNCLFHGQWHELPVRWNFQTHYFGCGLEDVFKPVIWHYLDSVKPWHDLVWPYDRNHVVRINTALAATEWPDFVRRQRTAQDWRRYLVSRLKALLGPLRHAKSARKRATHRQRISAALSAEYGLR